MGRPSEAWPRGWHSLASWSPGRSSASTAARTSSTSRSAALAQAYRPLNAALLLAWVLVGIGYEATRVRAPIGDVWALRDQEDPDFPKGGTALAATTMSLGGHHAAPALLLPQSPPVGVAFWVAVPIVAVLIDVTARRSGGRRADAEELVRFISTSQLVNVALVAAWAFAGYHLFAR